MGDTIDNTRRVRFLCWSFKKSPIYFCETCLCYVQEWGTSLHSAPQTKREHDENEGAAHCLSETTRVVSSFCVLACLLAWCTHRRFLKIWRVLLAVSTIVLENLRHFTLKWDITFGWPHYANTKLVANRNVLMTIHEYSFAAINATNPDEFNPAMFVRSFVRAQRRNDVCGRRHVFEFVLILDTVTGLLVNLAVPIQNRIQSVHLPIYYCLDDITPQKWGVPYPYCSNDCTNCSSGT